MKTKMIKADISITCITASKGGLFDISNEEMEADIGKLVKYINSSCGIEYEIFNIGGIQKDFKGDLCYRLFNNNCDFGRPAYKSQIEFL